MVQLEKAALTEGGGVQDIDTTPEDTVVTSAANVVET